MISHTFFLLPISAVRCRLPICHHHLLLTLALSSLPFACPSRAGAHGQEPTPWTDPITCDKEFQLCPQLDAGKLFVGSEDCLYLDVYVPEGAGEAGSDPLPVMAWLFGGGYGLAILHFTG